MATPWYFWNSITNAPSVTRTVFGDDYESKNKEGKGDLIVSFVLVG